jgi:hypothetical protein
VQALPCCAGFCQVPGTAISSFIIIGNEHEKSEKLGSLQSFQVLVVASVACSWC